MKPILLCGLLAYRRTGTQTSTQSVTPRSHRIPDDEPMRSAIAACRGLRVLRQVPWECLASFILSSNKQIVQIRQIIALLCERFGEPLNLPPTALHPNTGENTGSFRFPTPQRIAAATDAGLRACKMGFRAPHLLAAARRIAEGQWDLERPRHLPLAGRARN